MRYLVMSLLAAASLTAAINPQKDCSDDVLMVFFPKIFVEEVLKEHRIDKQKTDAIAKELATIDDSVITLIEERAKTMKPNPLEDMEAREARNELFSNALLKVFGDVLSRYDIKDRDVQIKMIEEIQNKRLNRWKECADLLPEGEKR